MWQQAFGTDYPTLSELRAAASASRSTSQAVALVDSGTTTDETASVDAAILMNLTQPEAKHPRFARFFSPVAKETAWELLATEQDYRIHSARAIEAHSIETWARDGVAKAHGSPIFGHDELNARLVDEAIAVLAL